MKCAAFTNTTKINQKVVSNYFYTSSKQFLLNFFLLVTLVFGTANVGIAQPDGGKIFKQNCSRCHKLDETKLTGPGMKGVFDRVPKPADEWLFKWIKNNKEVMMSGDAYGLKVFNDNAKQNMDVFDGVISDDEIKAVIAYIKNPLLPVDEKTTTVTEPKSPQDKGFSTFIVLLVAAISLLILVAVLGTIKKHLQDSVNAKNGLPATGPVSFQQWASGNKRLVAVLGILFVILLAKLTYEGLMTFSVDQDYLPAQPIKYSHQTHAGKLQINCVYCHSGAEKGRTAGVPSANVCMNCHKAVSEGPKTGKAEIAKIYDAVGWDPATGTYSKPQKPIQWVRVHSLPDFSYFNHSQHVVVGKQDCKNCHGDMATLDEAKQVSPLTMGWCIDCHRKTEVPGMATNPYYEELHAKLKEKYKGQPITVENMGGLDCIKCHY
ncbi:MAG: c-type cytochrome [Bacteroidetes bacterium]|nr:MAG: c-type cytochrome [Bacteroidota bacterium]